jgi:hypothetical protein
LTLLSKKDNENAENKDFEEKLKYYKQYAVPTNEFLSRFEKFTPDLIKKYREFLWESAKNAWKI